MRFIWGPIPPSKCFDPETADWCLLRSPPVERAVLQAAFGMAPCLMAAGLALQRAADGLTVTAFLIFLLLPAVLVPVHELVHLVGYLVNPRSPHLLTGIWLAHGIWYVVYDTPLPRGRVLLMLAAPFVALSVPLGLVAAVKGGSYGWGLAYLALMHAALCVGDFASLLRVVKQVPPGGFVHNNGWGTYWAPTRPLQLPPSESVQRNVVRAEPDAAAEGVGI